jgi:Flp pilus assembly pilin Flp
MLQGPPRTPTSAERLAAFARDQRGANMVEYIILVGVVAIVAMAGFKAFGSQVRAKVDQQADTVGVITSS